MAKPKTKYYILLFILLVSVSIASSIFTYLFLLHKTNYPDNSRFNVLKKTDKRSQKTGTNKIKLYFLEPDKDLFGFETRKIKSEDSNLKNIQNTLNELIKGPETEMLSTIPEGAQLLNLFIDKNNTLYLNFNYLLRENHPCGLNAEFQTIYCLFKTIFVNFNEISKIELLLDGESTRTLCGHIDLKASFEKILDFELEEECIKKWEYQNKQNIYEESDYKNVPSDEKSSDIPLYKPRDINEESIEEEKIN